VFGRLQRAIVDAYRHPEFEQLLRVSLDTRMDDIVYRVDGFRSEVFQVLIWAEREGVLGRLIRAVKADRPLKSDLQTVVDEILTSLPMASGAKPVSKAPVLQNPRDVLDSSLLLRQARTGLIRLWLPFGGLLFLIVIAQSIGNVFQDQFGGLWLWLLVTMLPTLSLVFLSLGVPVAELLTDQKTIRVVTVRSDHFKVARWCSWGYLALVLLTIFVQPVARDMAGEDARAIEVLNHSYWWLVPAQTFTCLSILLVYFTRQAESLSSLLNKSFRG
jgi:hypothetical protein